MAVNIRDEVYAPSHHRRWNKVLRSNKPVVLAEERCFYCDAETPPDERSVDHVISRSVGGTDDYINLVMACRRCNTLKEKFREQKRTRKHGALGAFEAFLLHLGGNHGVSAQLAERARVRYLAATAYLNYLSGAGSRLVTISDLTDALKAARL
jgi:5-methylcytosine-specific restriction endonuclease McrA